MKINRILSTALILSIIVISCSIVGCRNMKQANIKDLECEVHKGQPEYKRILDRELSDSQWIEDIDYLAKELPTRHKNLFFNITEEDFQKQIEGLKKEIPYLNDDEIKVGIQKIVASIGDAHTNVRHKFKKIFPLKFYWFEDKIYVINGIRNYEKIIYNQLVSINGKNIDDIIEGITKIVSHENSQWVKSILPQYIRIPQILHGLDLLEDIHNGIFTFKDSQGNLVDINIKSEIYSENIEWVINENHNKDTPLYRKKSDENYWYEYLPDSKTLYFKYNLCYEMDNKPIDEFKLELFDVLNKNQVDKFVIDLRNNMGGNERYLREFIDRIYIVEDEINKVDKLFFIIGRDTISSGLKGAIYAKKNTHATLVGEGSGGKPNHYGEINKFCLKNSHLEVTYSTKFFKDIDEDVNLLLPDINVEVTIKDYVDNKDPVLERILKD